MSANQGKELLGLVTSISLAVLVTVAGILVLGGTNVAAESSASDPYQIESQTPDEAGSPSTKKGVERFQVTDVQAMPFSTR